ncbi:hypothetical protein SLEP1_g6234 [Rubroshorea leprosula]|uniref:Uncharacterized protein n=1 Tax=Rubroshorea leprosula TaxID=152421 RepID=A0AAV5I0E4_9ROSI|nr:hypothetical protein SLEP1_g6234 [Rubroshorea leprosula]
MHNVVDTEVINFYIFELPGRVCNGNAPEIQNISTTL